MHNRFSSMLSNPVRIHKVRFVRKVLSVFFPHKHIALLLIISRTPISRTGPWVYVGSQDDRLRRLQQLSTVLAHPECFAGDIPQHHRGWWSAVILVVVEVKIRVPQALAALRANSCPRQRVVLDR